MEEKQITKKDDNTINVIKSVPVSFDFTPAYLKTQREAIIAQKERDNIQRDLEIAEVDEYLAKCVEYEVVEKPIELIKDAGIINEDLIN